MELLKKGERLYIDVEKLKTTDHTMVAGDVAIVNKKRQIILWAVIKRDEKKNLSVVSKYDWVHQGQNSFRISIDFVSVFSYELKYQFIHSIMIVFGICDIFNSR